MRRRAGVPLNDQLMPTITVQPNEMMLFTKEHQPKQSFSSGSAVRKKSHSSQDHARRIPRVCAFVQIYETRFEIPHQRNWQETRRANTRGRVPALLQSPRVPPVNSAQVNTGFRLSRFMGNTARRRRGGEPTRRPDVQRRDTVARFHSDGHGGLGRARVFTAPDTGVSRTRARARYHNGGDTGVTTHSRPEERVYARGTRGGSRERTDRIVRAACAAYRAASATAGE